MKVSEMIEWLKTQDQDATVRVVIGDGDYGWDGEDEYYYTTTNIQDFDPNTFGHFEFETYKSGEKTLTLGCKE